MTQGTWGSTRPTTRQNGWSGLREMNSRTPVSAMGLGRVVHAIGIKARHVFEGETFLWEHVHLARNAHAKAERTQVCRQAAGRWPAGGVVPGTAVAHGELPGVKLRAAGLADGHAQIGAIENQALRGERVQVWGARVLAAIQRQIVVGAVVSQNNEKVGMMLRRWCRWRGLGQRRPRHHRCERYHGNKLRRFHKHSGPVCSGLDKQKATNLSIVHGDGHITAPLPTLRAPSRPVPFRPGRTHDPATLVRRCC